MEIHGNNVVNVGFPGSKIDVYSQQSENVISTDNSPVEAEIRQAVEVNGSIAHFGLSPQLRAHWVDVYSRMVTAGIIKSKEVTSVNFVWLMCGEGTAPAHPIKWHGSTRELAYMVRRYLDSRWDVAQYSFKDKNDNQLPKTLKNTKAPNDESIKKIDRIFSIKD